MNLDEYNEVVNGDDTYTEIAKISVFRPVIVGWTDGEFTHLDVLFSLWPNKEGNIQRGLHQGALLFVSIVGRGCFGFNTTVDRNELHPSYVGEKLGMGDNVTTRALTELIEGVISALPGG